MHTIENYLANAAVAAKDVSSDRAELLQPLADYINACIKQQQPILLNFICTHNSRRSHLAQIWAQVFAVQQGISGVECFSGGTAATAFNPRAVAALQRAGLFITAEKLTDENLRYRVQIPNDGILTCFSKRFDDDENPQADFAAVMTCTEADAACPTVPGAEVRISLPYHDPKEADDTPQEAERYDERCLQIAAEMCWVMQQALVDRQARYFGDA